MLEIRVIPRLDRCNLFIKFHHPPTYLSLVQHSLHPTIRFSCCKSRSVSKRQANDMAFGGSLPVSLKSPRDFVSIHLAGMWKLRGGGRGGCEYDNNMVEKGSREKRKWPIRMCKLMIGTTISLSGIHSFLH